MKLEESYKILVDWSKYQHEKMQHFNTVNIAIHTLIITAIGYMIYHKDTWLLPQNLWMIPLIGFILGLAWFIGLCRLRLDVDVWYAQLRALERVFGEDIKQEQKIFTEGYNFYKCGQVNIEELKELKCRWKFFGFLTIYQIFSGIVLFVYFVVLLIQVIQAY
ncbi:MAG: hypothetical protein HZA09_07620 [Nitrospirae bacterium]|nr:hypothetical protein [Nitrospirota bacterium]